MNDMAKVIIPKSDQLNSDDLISGERTITITGVTIRGGQEQPISVHFEGDDGKPWKPCKSMCRVMVTAWGADSKAYVGRSLTLYRDASVKWAGMEVGGIRISHMSDIDSKLTMALTMTKSNRKPFTVQPLKAGTKAATTSSPSVATADSESGSAAVKSVAAPDDSAIVKDIETWCKRKKFDMALDLLRGITDEPLRESTKARIEKAKKYVEAQA